MSAEPRVFDPAHPALRTRVSYLLNRAEFEALVRYHYRRPDYSVNTTIPGQFGGVAGQVWTWTAHGQVSAETRELIARYLDGGLPFPETPILTHPHPQTLLCGLVLLEVLPAGVYEVDLTGPGTLVFR